ncbi:hypothetical protein BKA62DRAFT_361174 [Auriculariales sp. MPI-PUGE-AT-0066]|nr:hypothetical protein BKA62DRAFT_361174 [Auriculariales sp. MPI-PUGE-AT-0066]
MASVPSIAVPSRTDASDVAPPSRCRQRGSTSAQRCVAHGWTAWRPGWTPSRPPPIFSRSTPHGSTGYVMDSTLRSPLRARASIKGIVCAARTSVAGADRARAASARCALALPTYPLPAPVALTSPLPRRAASTDPSSDVVQTGWTSLMDRWTSHLHHRTRSSAGWRPLWICRFADVAARDGATSGFPRSRILLCSF